MREVQVEVLSPDGIDEKIYDAVMEGRFHAMLTLLEALTRTISKEEMGDLLGDHMSFLNATDLILAGDMKGAEIVARKFAPDSALNNSPYFMSFMGKPGTD